MVVLTLGDPNGLGPELVCRIILSGRTIPDRLLIIGPEEALTHHVRVLGKRPFWRSLPQADHFPDVPPGVYHFFPHDQERFCLQPGKATEQGGEAAGRSLEIACAVLARGGAQALVTCPLNKAMLQRAGFDHPGHTEFLTARAGLAPQDVCMHFWGPRLRVSLATTHPPLGQVPGLITQECILRKLELTLNLMRALGHLKPAVVCGLNPHAGENGHIGDEEARIIAPAVQRAVSKEWNVVGPLAADTVFRRMMLGEFSVALAMYHDQGLGPFKLLHFHTGIQVTLGLPYVRTSPDHGTGYELVGTGRASVRSLESALRMAVRLAAPALADQRGS